MHKKLKSYGLCDADFYACNNITCWREYVLVKGRCVRPFTLHDKINHLDIEMVYFI